jgi:hypothetical protein
MKIFDVMSKTVLGAAIVALVGGAGIANATEPCGDFGECKALIEINAEDGDIGFHFLMDGHDLIYGALFNPRKRKIFYYAPRREMRRQTSTELFQESAEHLCNPEDAEEEDDIVVTLEEFEDRFMTGTYYFFGINADWELQFGQTWMDFKLPAAPDELDWDELEHEISWEPGSDLGQCAEEGDIAGLVADGVLVEAPEDVEVALWEVVLEVDVEDGNPLGGAKYVVRIPSTGADEYGIEVPDDFLESLPDNTPGKIEVGAIGVDDNATFAEEGDICLNEVAPGCVFED